MSDKDEKKNIVEVRYTFWMIPRTTIKVDPKRSRLNIVFPDHMGKVSLVFKKDLTLDDFLDNLLKAITEYKSIKHI